MSKIKLFVEGHWFDDPYQSPVTFLKGLYEPMSHDSKFEIFIAASNLDQLIGTFKAAENMNYLQYKSPSKYYRLIQDIPQLIRKYKIHVGHYQYVSPLTKNAKEIVTVHDLLFKDFKDYFPLYYRLSKDFLFYRSAKRADLVTTVSKYALDSINRHYGIPLNKLILTPNGVSDDYQLENRKVPLINVQSKYVIGSYILCVSRIEPRKNHLLLLKAYCELRLWERGLALVFIGRIDIKVPDLWNYFDSLSADIKGNIKWIQGIPFEELLSFYKHASILVYPSFAEGFGMPPLEAAAMGTKVLCSNATAMSDFQFFRANLFDPQDLTEFKRKLTKVLFEDSALQEESIVTLIRKNYSWSRISSDFSKQIIELVKND